MESPPDIRAANVVKIPPFADSHIHFIIAGRPAAEEELPGLLDACRQSGIFSLMDMGHKTGIGLKVKNAPHEGVSVLTAGYALYKKGGYGAFLGRSVTGREEIQEAVRGIADAGADFVKVINSGVVSPKGSGLVTEGGFSFDELRVIYDEARTRNLQLVCHANSDSAIRVAVRAGASSIEHGFFVGHETLHMMAETGTAWTPTPFALQSLIPTLGVTEKRYIEEVVEDHLSSICYAASLGLKLRIGTDSGSQGVRHGESFFAELRLWQRAGLAAEQILSAACMDTGEVEKGNYLLVRKDFISTGKVEAAYQNGIRLAR